ncbi:hypothetical protein RHGRI_025633 [Rhododendron griersonianum]|uniref:Protein ENHANCED DISEASE RESISTANCE 2 C-terminal domain-containing protein n=1 Tax=Rhododendron griersonianum TaxID=479676 RepID=A0AAV6ITB3_9ERIC|nr:hypothetical protein RHGRI_025633 [Rhododendron griersonianum]
MAKTDSENENGWIERVKEEGDFPLLEPENCPNGWATPPADTFRVRGPEYFLKNVKIPGGEYLLKPLGFDCIKGPAKISQVLKDPKNRVRKVLDEEFPTGNKPRVWAFNFQFPSKENHSVIAYFVAREPIPDGSLLDQFWKGDDGFRRSRLKVIANVPKGPWVVRKAVGDNIICVIGRVLTCHYYVADNVMEVDIDVGSSMGATSIGRLCLGYLTKITIDLAFLIESQAESELPERILGAVRFSQLDVAAAREVELSSDGSAANLQSSLTKRVISNAVTITLHSLFPDADITTSKCLDV